MTDHNKDCPLSDPESFINPALRGLECTCATENTNRELDLEIQDEEKRRLAKAGLAMLWEAMELFSPSPILQHPGYAERYACWMRTWENMGQMLLGDDCPYKEVNT